MEGNDALEIFKEVLQGIYAFMLRIKIPVFKVEITLWTLFLYGLVGGLVVWFIRKFFK